MKKNFRRCGGGSTGDIVSVTGTGSGEHNQYNLVKHVSVSTHPRFGRASSNLASTLVAMFWARIGRTWTWTCPTGHLFDRCGGKMTQNGGGTVSGGRKDERELKIVIVGDGGCGKTSLLMVYAKGDFPEVRRVTDEWISKINWGHYSKIHSPKTFLMCLKTEICAVSVWKVCNHRDGGREGDKAQPVRHGR